MPANTPPRIGLHTGHDTQRRETEAFIGSVYAKAYGAELTGFMPVLMALRGLDGAPEAALGLHPACEGPLFLEHYLDTPIEVALGQALDRAG
ncbi:MAG: thermostable hemolysin, partial [Gammaproteobacteria bacterium]